MNIPDELREDPRFCGWCRHWGPAKPTGDTYNDKERGTCALLIDTPDKHIKWAEETCDKWEEKP